MIARDQIVATVLFGATVAVMLNREPAPEKLDDRLVALAIVYVAVLLWRLIAKIPVFGLIERFASDYRTANMNVLTAIICWLLFLFFCAAAAFG